MRLEVFPYFGDFVFVPRRMKPVIPGYAGQANITPVRSWSTISGLTTLEHVACVETSHMSMEEWEDLEFAMEEFNIS